MQHKYRLLIGGIGDDAHSVGIRLLELGFIEAEFHVKNIGIRNSIDRFFEEARHADVIMISNKNGHAELYLHDFAAKLSAFQLSDNSTKLWYLGGSLSVSESDFHIKKKFINMGFTGVYPRPISFAQVLENITQDLYRFEISKKQVGQQHTETAGHVKMDFNIVNRQLTREELDQQRADVLTEWPTGKDVVGIGYKVNPVNTLDYRLWKNKLANGSPLFQPRTGVADIEQQISKLKFLEQEGSDISSVQLDAASRSGMYDKARLGVEMSIERKTSQLNGFPIPIYGVKEVNRLVTSVNSPFQLRGGGPDHRFTYEVALNAGITAVEGGFLCYCLPYDKLTSPSTSLKYWQYIDRLCTLYADWHGIHINREYFGVLTATLIEPSLAIVINIVQAIASAQQGVKSISVGYAEQGNRVQDIAAIQMMDKLVNHYLNKEKFRCKVTTVFHQFMAAFPADYEKAEQLIFQSAITATLASATKVMVKTAAEAIKIPDRFDNAKAVKLCKQATLLANINTVNQNQLDVEKSVIRREVSQLMNVIIELGNGQIVLGALKAVDQGIIDIPWSPNIYNKNKVINVRDVNGAVRFYDFGNMPFDSTIKDFHANHVMVRKNMERDSSIFSLLEKDLSRIWKNDYKQWPLDGTYVTA
ncbi:methylaspartate mutase subunit E [Mucilaginibacter sp. 21P]|uniref:methylaspartate mutase subunit E n=1 Tax=Mucilaginibacter sp. 21P TaxID=2778902 RepID=UPI001C56B25F|nr:methylaspartate mutase subunit E [Mucilaginibacter sp. 21P]QXV63872.1 methylaspartate mutase subunit E [Mucilaginibacter sp. 21P]